jgi:hypothetical protein
VASLAVTTSGELVPPASVTAFVPKYHWMVEGLPAATALNETVAPELAVWLAGEVVTTGKPEVGSATTVTASISKSAPKVVAELSVNSRVVFVDTAVKDN